MKKYSSEEIIKMLYSEGYRFYHCKGSHMVLVKDGNYVHVPRKEKVIRKNILRHIVKKTGLDLL